MNKIIPLLLFLLFLVIPLTSPLHAQAEQPDCSQFHPDAQREGDFCLFPELPELNFINIIEKDEAGRMWVATDGRGLNLIENGTVRNWQPETSEIRQDAIRGFAVRDGIAVVGLFGCGGCGGVGVYNLEADQWSHFWYEDEAEPELSGGGVGGVAIDAEGRIYMPTGNQTLDIWDGTQWQHFTEDSNANEPFRRIADSSDSLFDTNGVLWVGYDDGLRKFDGTTWERVTSFPLASVTALAYDAERELIWVATTSGLLVGNEADGWKQVPPIGTNSDPNGEWFHDVALDDEGRAWVIGNKTLALFNGTAWESYPPEVLSGEFPSWGNALAFDENGYLWLESGLIGRLAVFTGESTLPPSTATLETIEGNPPPEYEPMPIVTISPMDRLRPILFVLGSTIVCLGVVVFNGIIFYLRRSSRNAPLK